MKIVIPGGSGFLGQYLSKRWTEEGNEVYVLTRGDGKVADGVTYLKWDGTSAEQHRNVFEGAALVVNLTGKSVDCRYTEENKKRILSSRVDSTRAIGTLLTSLTNPPKYWMNASSATIYRDSYDQLMTESTGQIGDDFSMSVCQAWEDEFYSHDLPDTKRAALRITLILGKDGGVLPVLTRLAKFGMGGRNSHGRQFFSWMHEEDTFRALNFIMENGLEGPINLGSPEPLTDAEFNQLVRKSVGTWFGPPKPRFSLELGAWIMGTETELVLKSRKVYPEKLLEAGFDFLYPDAASALSDLTK